MIREFEMNEVKISYSEVYVYSMFDIVIFGIDQYHDIHVNEIYPSEFHDLLNN